MQIITTIAELRAFQAECAAKGETFGLVPTMGALHEGHMSLVRAAKAQSDRVAVSIFVNPTQFGPNEDFDSYPRVIATDAALLEPYEVDVLYTPSVGEMYPEGFTTTVSVGDLTNCLCGAKRIGHFDGVATVVSKLLLQSRADHAYFGEKDWQQLQVIRRVNTDLNIDCAITGVKTARNLETGLALSSRNSYLNAEELIIAATLNVTLAAYARAIRTGTPIQQATQNASEAILNAGFAHIDYLECRTAQSLSEVTVFDPATPCHVFVAAKLGPARLIDNMLV